MDHILSDLSTMTCPLGGPTGHDLVRAGHVQGAVAARVQEGLEELPQGVVAVWAQEGLRRYSTFKVRRGSGEEIPLV